MELPAGSTSKGSFFACLHLSCSFNGRHNSCEKQLCRLLNLVLKVIYLYSEYPRLKCILNSAVEVTTCEGLPTLSLCEGYGITIFSTPSPSLRNISKGHPCGLSSGCRHEQLRCVTYFINGKKTRNLQPQVRKRNKFLMISFS